MLFCIASATNWQKAGVAHLGARRARSTRAPPSADEGWWMHSGGARAVLVQKHHALGIGKRAAMLKLLMRHFLTHATVSDTTVSFSAPGDPSAD
jgi:hypothetical protein